MLGVAADDEWMTILEGGAVCQKQLIPGKKNENLRAIRGGENVQGEN